MLYNAFMKIGIYGGTFNPPHKTHVNIAFAAKAQLGLDKLLVVPGGTPPHKPCDVDRQTRLALTKLAFEGVGEVSEIEIWREGKTYTADTVEQIAAEYPDAELYLVIGGDSLCHFDEWYEPWRIAKYVTLAVAARVGNTPDAADFVRDKYGCNVTFLQFEPNDVSSSEIRLRYRFGMDNSDFVPKAVDDFVFANNLYSEYRHLAIKLKEYLTEKRFLHTLYVVKRGQELCCNNISADKAYIACLLHDCAKYISPEHYDRYGFCPPSDMPQSVIHAFLGAVVAQVDFGINDTEILDAIKYHCTAKPNMSELEMLVYVADKTEQTRPYPTEHLLVGTLKDMFVACLEEANSFCLTNHADNVYYLTKQALDFYAKK